MFNHRQHRHDIDLTVTPLKEVIDIQCFDLLALLVQHGMYQVGGACRIIESSTSIIQRLIPYHIRICFMIYISIYHCRLTRTP